MAMGCWFISSGLVHSRFPGFEDGRPALFLVVDHIHAALLQRFGLVVDAGRNVVGLVAHLVYGVTDGIGRLQTHIPALALNLVAGLNA